MTEPSKVIHVRNVGHEISESDLLQLVQPFGAVSKLVMLRAKNQALLQMHDVASAVSALQYYTNVQASISARDQPLTLPEFCPEYLGRRRSGGVLGRHGGRWKKEYSGVEHTQVEQTVHGGPQGPAGLID